MAETSGDEMPRIYNIRQEFFGPSKVPGDRCSSASHPLRGGGGAKTTGYATTRTPLLFLRRIRCETLLPLSFKWQPNIATMFQDRSPKTDGHYLEATLQAHQKLRTLLFSSPFLAVVQENLHRLIKLLNLQWLLQNRDRTELKNPIENLAIRVTCDHYNVEVRINLLGCFIHLITGSVRQLQVQKHEIEFLLPEAFNGLFSRTDHHSTEADSLQKCSKQILQAQ